MIFKHLYQSWWRFFCLGVLGIILSLRLSQSVQAQIAPAQLVIQAQKSYQIGEFEVSIKLLEQARRIYRQQSQDLQQAQILALTSLAQQEMGNWQIARENLTASEALLEYLPENSQKNQVLAQIWQTKGNLNFALGDHQAALSNWQQAEQLYRQNRDDWGIGGSLLAQSQALENMGFYRRACDRLLVALELADADCRELTPPQITAILETVKQDAQPWQIESLNAVANSLLLMGQLAQAKQIIQGSQKINSQLNHPSPLITAKILLSWGNFHKAIANQAKAVGNQSSFEQHFQIARKYYQQLLDKKTTAKIADKYRLPAQLNLLSLLVLAEQWSAAEQLVPQIQLYTEQPRRRNLYAELKFARDLERLKQQQLTLPYTWQDLAQIYSKAIAQAQAINNLRIQSYGMGYLGTLSKTHPELSLATSPQRLLETALNLAQQSNALEIAYGWQWKLGQIYREQGNTEAAIASYQAAIRTLTEIRSDLASLTREIQFDFEAQIRPVYLEFVDLLLASSSPTSEHLTMAMDGIEALQVAELDNFFQDACLTFEPRSIDRIDSQAVAIYAIALPDRLEVILAASNSGSGTPGQILRHHTSKISQTALTQQVSQLRQYLTEPDRTRQVQQLSAQLYDLLLRPLADDLASFHPQNLVFILDSILQPIPMAILYDGEQYLLEKYAIATTPGLRMLNPQGNYAVTPSLLAGGISHSLQVNNQNFLALKNVETELATLKNPDTQILLNTQFTPNNLLQQINATSASQIHLATHGQFSSNPHQTFLLMWHKLLTIKEFSNLLHQRQKVVSNPINLMVLSACDTALGDRRAALGLAGIAVRSGALTTIATLWQVNDQSTAVLMKHFYKYLDQNYGKAEALRQAQLDLRKMSDRDWQVPAFWAGYVVIGNWQ